MNPVKKVLSYGRHVVRRTSTLPVLAALALMFMFANNASAQALTDTGIDVPALILLAVALLAAIVSAVLGSYFSFVVIKLGIRWINRLLGG